MKKIIFGLISEMAGGKDTTKQYLEKSYQVKSCRFSSILRDILDRLYLEQSRANMQELSTGLRQTFGEDILAKTITQEVCNLDAEIIIVDGVRRPADIKYLRELNNFYLVAIKASPELRYQRLVKRAENQGDAEKTWKEFLADHQTEADKEIADLITEADYFLNNNEDLTNLYSQIDKLVEKVQNS